MTGGPIGDFNLPGVTPMPEYSPLQWTLPIDRRFRLVEIAFEKALANQAQKEQDIPADLVAKAVVAYADAVLAEMEKKPEAERDDGKQGG